MSLLGELKSRYEEQLTEDPVLRWFQRNGKVIFYGILVVWASFYLWGLYSETQKKSAREMADSFAQVQTLYESWVNASEDKEKKLGELRTALSKLNKNPYRAMVPVYETLIALEEGKATSINSSAPSELNRFLGELQRLAIARSKIDSSREEAIKDLEALGRSGKFIRGNAVAVLEEVAASESEKSLVAELRKLLLEAEPFQSVVLGK
jgi:predicted negative regulator of RcsB-dependent stress response